GFAFNLDQFGNGGLHTESQFVIGNRRFKLIQLTEMTQHAAIEASHQSEFILLELGFCLERFDIGDRLRATTENRSLIGGGQEATAKILQASWRNQTAV